MKATAVRRFFRGVVMGLAFLVGLFGVMQLVPYGRARANPPVVAEPAWDSPRTRELAKRACFDCHSNETRWPWYAKVAPMSWAMERDVTAGRSVMNFSEWNRHYVMSSEAHHAVLRADMPLKTYLVLHDDAKLTHDEKVELANGLKATFGR
jgi:hypothetical protein